VGEHGGVACVSAAEAAAGADVLITNVPADPDVAAIAAEALPRMAEGALFIDHSTVSAALARDIAAAHPAVHCVDAPVSGGQAGAEAGRLSVMCGASAAGFAAARPIMAAYGATITHVGPPGHGQLAKMANQVAIAGLVQALAEALSFARCAGLDMAALLAAIGGGAAQSWQMDNRARTMLEGRFDFGFAVDLMRKDLGLVLEEARRVGATLPVAALVDQFYAEVQGAGGGRLDTSSLITRLP
jgi:3-hydroxyisobutyrate dehydrogenase